MVCLFLCLSTWMFLSWNASILSLSKSSWTLTLGVFFRRNIPSPFMVVLNSEHDILAFLLLLEALPPLFPIRDHIEPVIKLIL